MFNFQRSAIAAMLVVAAGVCWAGAEEDWQQFREIALADLRLAGYDAAAEAAFKQALKSARRLRSGDWRLRLSLVDLSRFYLSHKRFDESRRMLEELAGLPGDDYGMARDDRVWRGLFALISKQIELHRIKELRILLPRIWPGVARATDSVTFAAMTFGFAEDLLGAGYPEESYLLIQPAIADVPAEFTPTMRVNLLTVAGLAAKRIGHLDEGERHYRDAIGLLRNSRGDPTQHATLSNDSRKRLETDLGERFDWNLIAQALDSEQRGPCRGLLALENNLGMLLEIKMDYAAAAQQFRDAIRHAAECGEEEIPTIYSGLANVLVRQGYLDDARNAKRRALEVLGPNPDPRNRPYLYSLRKSLIVLKSYKGDDAAVIPDLQQLLAEVEAEAKRPGLPRDTARNFALLATGIRSDVGTLLVRIGEVKHGVETLEAALAEARALYGQDSAALAHFLDDTARGRLANDQPAEARDAWRQALSYLARTLGPMHTDSACAHAGMGLVAALMGEPADAGSSLASALEIYETQTRRARLGVAADVSQRQQLQRCLGYAMRGYSLLLDTSATPELQDQAFRLFQLLKNHVADRAFAETAAQLAVDDASIAAGIRDVRTRAFQVERLEQRLAERIDDKAEVRHLAKAIREQEADLRAAQESLQNARPRYADLFSRSPYSLAEFRASLGPAEALVSIHLAQDAAYVVFVSGDDLRLVRLAGASRRIAELAKNVASHLYPAGRDVRAMLLDPFPVGQAYELYETLIAPGQTVLAGKSPVYYVPDGVLAQLPPSVMIASPPTITEPELIELPAYDWWIRRQALIVMPGESALIASKMPPAVQKEMRRFIGFGAPTLAAGPNVPQPDPDQGLSFSQLPSLPALPGAATELASFAGHFNVSDDHVHVGSDATLERLRGSDLDDYRIVAFATHAVMVKGESPPDRPQPALVLSPGDNAPRDAALTMGDIVGLRMNASLVILSACNTAEGLGRTADRKLSGLVYAFLIAGSKGVIASYWPVESATTVLLMGLYAGNLQDGQRPSEALRDAMLQLMDSRSMLHLPHPMAWAPFVHHGEDLPVR